MASVHDVAAYFLAEIGEMTTMKLQKLVYYSQAWHLVWEDQPLFEDRIEAWANGPVAPALYEVHRGKYQVSKLPAGEPSSLSTGERRTLEVIRDTYGQKSGHWLSQLTHMESPWREARQGLAAGQRGSREITHAAMAEFYAELDAEGEPV